MDFDEFLNELFSENVEENALKVKEFLDELIPKNLQDLVA